MDNNNLFNGQQDDNKGQQSYGQQGMYQQQNTYQQLYEQQNTYQQPYGQQNIYQQNQPAYGANQLESPISVKEWIITYLIMFVPFVNLVMMFVWAFGSNTKRSKSNYFKAMLIIIGIFIVIYIILIVIVGTKLRRFIY